MCGIVGIVGRKPAASRLLEALRHLEYRGYDSAGLATVSAAAPGGIARLRVAGKLEGLAAALAQQPLPGSTGIGHTRWATHGAATVANAHPHQVGQVAVVHNGIIENAAPLRASLERSGAVFSSATDSEVIAHLVHRHMDEEALEPVAAAWAALEVLQGAFAVAMIFGGADDLMVAARQGSPMAVGFGVGQTCLASDAAALAVLVRQVCHLEDGDRAVLTRAGVVVENAAGERQDRARLAVKASELVGKGRYRHFMAKEIFEQPEVVGRTFARHLDLDRGRAALGGPDASPELEALLETPRLTIVGCGSAYLAGLAGKYWIESLAGIPVDVVLASEFPPGRPAPGPPASAPPASAPPATGTGLQWVFVSQSGETADTLAALRQCKAGGGTTAAIVNVPGSTLAREADLVLPTEAGLEIGVASTKAFTCQLAVLAVLAVALARRRGMPDAAERAAVAAFAAAPRVLTQCLHMSSRLQEMAAEIATCSSAMFIGRGPSYPLALEGALKLKEISYVHAEGYAAGELKHGPIALVDAQMPVIALAPHDDLFVKTLSNVQEVAARGGRVFLLSDARGCAEAQGLARDAVALPGADVFVRPLVQAVAVQLLAYHTAVRKGTDVDQPRNLAKSVTVE